MNLDILLLHGIPPPCVQTEAAAYLCWEENYWEDGYTGYLKSARIFLPPNLLLGDYYTNNGVWDLQGLVTHEIGHTLGLNDYIKIKDKDKKKASMYNWRDRFNLSVQTMEGVVRYSWDCLSKSPFFLPGGTDMGNRCTYYELRTLEDYDEEGLCKIYYQNNNEPDNNREPAKVNLLNPADNSQGIDPESDIIFNWDSSAYITCPNFFSGDPDCNKTRYNLTITEDRGIEGYDDDILIYKGPIKDLYEETPQTLVQIKSLSLNDNEKIKYNRMYWWAVWAEDSLGANSQMPDEWFHFSTLTSTSTNHSPDIPFSLSVTLGLINGKIRAIFSWKGNDVDEDLLRYKLIIRKYNPSGDTVYEGYVDTTTFTYDYLDEQTEYYWSVFAEDDEHFPSLMADWQSFVTGSPQGDLMYVNDDYPDSEDTDGDNDFRHIQAAIDAAETDDIILVADGTYCENINFNGKTIIVQSLNGPETTIIDGGQSGSVVTFNSDEGENSVLNGFTVINGSNSGIYCHDSSPTITNCTIASNSADTGGGIYCKRASSPRIINCTITGNSANSGGGLWCMGETGFWSGSATISSPHLINCTISGNQGFGIYSYQYSNPIVENSILWDNDPGEIGRRYGSYSVSYSNVKDGVSGNNNINSDPLFINPIQAINAPTSAGDFHIQPLSPCVDAANSDSAPITDKDGNSRYDDPGSTNTGTGANGDYYDIGAYESLVSSEAPDKTLEVGNSGYPYTSIQDAIDAASHGDTILVHNGTYIENLDLNGKAVNLRSENGSDYTTIDGNYNGSVVTFYAHENTDTILDGFTIINGSNSGIYCYGSSPTILNCVINNNATQGNHGNGGGVYCGDSSAIIKNCVIKENTAGGYGGGIYCSGALTITNCSINNNSAGRGGGIHCYGTPKIENCVIKNNSSLSEGGGIHCYGTGTGTLTMIDCTISDNSTVDFGGGIYFQGTSGLISHCVINNNKTTNKPTTGSYNSKGGGIHCCNASLIITNCTIFNNRTTQVGGGVCLWGSSPKIKNCTISGNFALQDGDGIYMGKTDAGSSPYIIT